MKKFVFLTAVFIFSMLGASDVFACSCLAETKRSESKKVKAAYKDAAAVFYGEVIEVNRQADSLIVKFKVERSWKGQTARETVVRTAENSAMCGFNFEVGVKYLVYADRRNNNLETDICTRTSVRNADAKHLNKVKKPKYFAKGSK